MKKTLIALAAFAAVSSFAQSTVTLFGGADLNYRSVESGANKFSGISQDGIYSSRIGFKGVTLARNFASAPSPLLPAIFMLSTKLNFARIDVC